MLSRIKKFAKSAWVRHAGFWVLSLCILTAGFATSWPVTMADVIYTLLFHISLVVAVYLHLNVCVPFFLLRRKYARYGLALLIIMTGAVYLNELTYRHLSDWIFPGYYFISYYSYWEIALFIGVYLLVTTLLRFSRSWAELQRTKLALEETRRRNAETELYALRDQVSPHFLFNSLHSIYALALEGNARTADLILRLADILRFLLYESQKEKILLSQEVECIEAYIALQRERLPVVVQVSFEKRIAGKAPEIAPLMLMPLVENAFKHGNRGHDTVIHMTLTYAAGKLCFEVSNLISLPGHSDMPGGLGLQNLRRRLALQYPNHSLRIAPSGDSYLVRLTMDL